jgi:hypothetical protein
MPYLCWLLVVSVGQHWPVRTPLTVSYFLPIPKRQSTIASIDSLIFTKGNVDCARDSHLHHGVDRLLSSIAPPSLRRLDQTKHYLAATSTLREKSLPDCPFGNEISKWTSTYAAVSCRWCRRRIIVARAHQDAERVANNPQAAAW